MPLPVLEFALVPILFDPSEFTLGTEQATGSHMNVAQERTTRTGAFVKDRIVVRDKRSTKVRSTNCIDAGSCVPNLHVELTEERCGVNFATVEQYCRNTTRASRLVNNRGMPTCVQADQKASPSDSSCCCPTTLGIVFRLRRRATPVHETYGNRKNA